MIKVAIIVGSTRPGRKADAAAKWVYQIAETRHDAEYEIVDIQDFHLPLLDSSIRPRSRRCSARWSPGARR
jgi:NAD(P)H-dependent FMN reductase